MDFVRMSDPWTLLMRVTETLDNLFFYASRNCLSHLQKHAKQCIHISHCPTSYRCILFVVKRFAFMSNKTDTRSFRMVDQGWWEKDTEREREKEKEKRREEDRWSSIWSLLSFFSLALFRIRRTQTIDYYHHHSIGIYISSRWFSRRNPLVFILMTM